MPINWVNLSASNVHSSAASLGTQSLPLPFLDSFSIACQSSAICCSCVDALSIKPFMACVDWFDQFDVLMTPSAPDEAPLGYASTGASTFNRAWTLLGLPCVNVAGAVGVTGNPMGLQIIGASRADRQCLAAADFVERALSAQA